MKRGVEWLIGGLTVAVLLLDCLTPRGWSVSLFYLPSILATYRLADRRAPILLAAICTFLVILASFVSPPGVPWSMDAVNQASIMILFWVTARFVVRMKRIVEERARLTDALERQKTELQLILESSLDCIITLDHTGQIVEFNRAAERTFGYSREMVLGRSMAEVLIPAEMRKAHSQGMARYLSTGEGPILDRRIEISALRADGTEFPIELTVTAVHSQGNPLFTAFLRDITERRQAEAALLDKRLLKAALQSAETLFRNLVEHSLVGIHIIQDDRFAYVNPKLAEIFGYTPGEVLAMDSWLTLAAEEDRAAIAEHVRQRIVNEVPSAQYEFRGLRKDGTVIDVEVRGSRTVLSGRPAVIGSLVDITERKRAETALRESEERFRNAFEHTNVAMVLTDLHHRFVRLNPAFAQLFGYTASAMLNLSMADITHPDDLRESNALRTALISGAIPYFEMEMRYRHRDGHILWGLVNVSLVRDAQGQPQYYVGQVQDITDRKRAEDQLRASEERFATIFRSSPVGICITTLDDGRFIDVNDAFLGLVGHTREEVLGHTAFELGYLSDPNNREKLLRDLRETGSVSNSEHTFWSKDGTIHHSLRSLESITLDGRACILTLLNDITERKQAEELLRESEEQLRLTTTSSNTGLWNWDLRTNQVYYSTIWKRQVGHEEQEVSDRLEEWRDRVHPDDLQRALATVNDYLNKAVPTYESEFRFRHKDGSYRWILAQGKLMDDDHGRPCRLMGSHIDITERKLAEMKLKQTADRLGTLLMTSQLLGSTLDLDALLNQLLRHLTNVVSVADFAAIYIYDSQSQLLIPRACAGVDAEAFRQIRLKVGEAISGRVLQLGQSVLSRTREEIAAMRGPLSPETERQFAAAHFSQSAQSNICVPLNSQTGEVIGTLSLGSARGEFTEDDRSLLEAIAAQTSIAIRNADLFDEVRSGRQRLQLLSRQLLIAQEAERSHIARELHDEIGQVLTAVGFHLHTLVEICGPESRVSLEEDIALVDQAIQQVRDLSLDLRPPTLDLLGLEPTLRAYLQDQSRRTGLRVQLSGHLESRLSPELEITCYRVVQATLTNVIRHARARQVWIELKQHEDELQVTIRDDGVGFDVAEVWQRALQRGSFGLLGVQERVELIGGRLTVESKAGSGTTIGARFPLRPFAAPT